MILCTVGRQPPIPPSAAFGPLAEPAASPALATYRARPPPTARWGLPCVTLASPSSSFFSALAGVKRPNRVRRSWPPSRRAPAASRCIHAVHVPRATTAISSRRRHPWLSPTLAARGIQSPAHLPAAGREGRGEEEEEPGAASPAAKPELCRQPRSRSRLRGGAGPAGATHACDLCFLDFLFAAPFCVPYQRRLPPRHSTAHPSSTPTHRLEATQVRAPPHLLFGRRGLRAERNAPAPPRRCLSGRPSSQAGMPISAGAAAFVDARATRLAFPPLP
jgi:hypothetical protein